MSPTTQSIYPVSAGRDETGCLTIAGHNLRPLAEQYGTPLYLYDAATLRGQASRLREELVSELSRQF